MPFRQAAISVCSPICIRRVDGNYIQSQLVVTAVIIPAPHWRSFESTRVRNVREEPLTYELKGLGDTVSEHGMASTGY